MEGVEYVTTKNGGVIKLPPGFRFRPTDEELVTQYLRRKVASLPLPATVIPEVNLWKHNPWDLHGGDQGEKYFFTTLEDIAKRSRGNKSVIRTTSSGFWKTKGKPKAISSSRGGRMIGTKTTFVFHRQEKTRSHKTIGASCTNWMMDEYRLPDIDVLSRYIRENAAMFNGILPVEMKDWVVCKIFQKGNSTSSSTKRAMNKQEVVLQESNNGDLVPSVSLAISCVTDLDDDEKENENEEEEEEEISS